MQPLSREQIETLAQEYTRLAEWTTIRDFCTQVYGQGRTAKVEIEIDSEYNDEGGYDYSVSSLTATSASGEELEFNLALPFWQQFEDLALELKKSRELYTDTVRAELAGIDELLENTPYTDRAARYALSEHTRQILRDLGDPKDEEELQDMAEDALKEWYPWREEDKAQAKTQGWIEWSELPASQDGETEFDLTTPPGISFPDVYAPT